MGKHAHARFLRGGRQSEPLTCFAITKCIEHRKRFLVGPIAWSAFSQSLTFLRQVGQIKVIAFCMMPDHFHLLAFLVGDKSLSSIVGSICKHMSLQLNDALQRKGRLWQKGFFDRKCRGDDIHELLSYMQHNPVRAGLVQRAEDWTYSSANPVNSSLLDRAWYQSVV